jgi:L-alanine-DL-glutamate epimerase-like enolase superfamily enzyme
MMRIDIDVEQWPVRRPFKIAYHTFHHRDLLSVTLNDGVHVARGEAGGHPQLESIADARARLEALRGDIARGITRAELLEVLPRGPARNALDCALWDLEAKRSGRRVWSLAGLPAPRPVVTAYTIGIAPLASMVEEAVAKRDYRILKLKVDGESGFDLLWAIADVRPDARFIIDANEAWGFGQLETFVARARALRVMLIEQPLPRADDSALAGFHSPIPLAADESFHGLPDVERLADRYQVINIKLDKIGGLTEALAAKDAARACGMGVMVGCNGGTSLGIAPAYCLALACDYVDLDSPLLLGRDRSPALTYAAGAVHPPEATMWG